MNKISSELRNIAARIDASKSPSASLVAADIKKVIVSMEREARVAKYASLITSVAAVTIENKDHPGWKTGPGKRFEDALEAVSKADKDELYDAVRAVFQTARRFGDDLDPEK